MQMQIMSMITVRNTLVGFFLFGLTFCLKEGQFCNRTTIDDGICKTMFDCDNIFIPGVDPPSSFCDLTGSVPMVCCPIKKAPSIDIRISTPTYERIFGCGYPYGLAIHNGVVEKENTKVYIYHWNHTAEKLQNEGFNITVNAMFDDAIFNFTYSNESITETKSYVSVGGVAPVGGRPALRTRGYYMALLGKREGDQTIRWSCDGVLINSKWVLSAAHCFLRKSTSPDVLRLGEYDWKKLPTNRFDNQPIDYEIEKIIFHPKYKASSRYYDLVLLKIPKSIPLLQHSMNPICLPWGDEMYRNPIGRNVTLSGWGVTSYNSPSKTNILQEVDLEVFNSSICNEAYKKLSNYETGFPMGITEETILCVGDEEGGKDACQGDSGGPLAYQSEDETIYLLGIVSGGHGCGLKDFPGLYIPINNAENLAWIKETAFPDEL